MRRQPGRAAGEAGLCAVVPLHGRAAAIAPDHEGEVPLANGVFDLAAFTHGDVAHADLFTIIKKRRATLCKQEGRCHLETFIVIAFTNAGSDAFHIVIVEYIGRPGFRVECLFPALYAVQIEAWTPGKFEEIEVESSVQPARFRVKSG